MNPYTKLLERKRTWTPVKPTKGEVRSGAEETIKRALAIRHMELPVGEFISQGLDKEVPESARTLLESNVKDEIKHDLALGFIVESHGSDPIAEMEAIRLRDAWIQHPDHTILKALVAERAIFFVLLPMFRFLGDKAICLIHDSAVFEWNSAATDATSNRATIISGAPTASRHMLVSTPASLCVPAVLVAVGV